MDSKSEVIIRRETDDPADLFYLKRLADLLHLPAPSDLDENGRFYLILKDSRLELHLNNPGKKKQTPVYVDFLSGPTYYRFTHDRRINQPLAKAVGIKHGFRPLVLDATAGFGEDGFVLASLGCMVTMIERSPIIWTLLDNGIGRCSENKRVNEVFCQRVTLHLADSVEFLNSTDQIFDTIYLDPMYTSSPRSSLNKQKMRLLRELVEDDTDSEKLLISALKHASGRVVVKRPARADCLNHLPPSFSITSKSSRYDIYLTP